MEKINLISEILQNFEEEKKGKICVQYYKNRTVNDVYYDDFIIDVKKMVSFIEHYGLKGKKIAILGNSSYIWIIAMLGIMCSGSIAIPLDKGLSVKEMKDMLFQSENEYILYGRECSEEANELITMLKCSGTCLEDENQISCFDNFDAENVEFCKEPDKIAMYLYTSGTTGKNKIVMMKQRGMADNVCSMTKIYPHEREKVIVASPLYHAYGVITTLTALNRGDILCINDDIRYVTRDFKNFAPTVMYCVPMIAESMYKQLNTKKISNDDANKSLKLIITAGAPLNYEIVKGYRRYNICVLQGYGLTETLLSNFNTTQFNKAGTVGRVLDCANVKIVDGEVWISTGSMCAGYYKDDVENKKCFVNKWIRTGDIGKFDDDGFLTITGRIKNLIIHSDGNNVSPEELERRILSAMPYVVEVLVHDKDDKICAQLYCGVPFSESLNKKIALDIEKLNEEMPEYKCINDFYIRETPLERTSSKKIKRSLINV